MANNNIFKTGVRIFRPSEIKKLIDAIPKAGQGQALCVLRGREITFLARAASGKAIDRGASVRVVSKTGSTVVVEPVV